MYCGLDLLVVLRRGRAGMKGCYYYSYIRTADER